MNERKYAFRQRLEVVHKPNRRDPEARPQPDEAAVGDRWHIVVHEHATPLITNVAKDLQDYLLESMNVSVPLRKTADIRRAAAAGEHAIVLATRDDLPEMGTALSKPRSYRIVAEADRIVICGCDERGVGQGSYYLEDAMNLREAPYVRMQDIVREPLFSPRMAHSGWGLDRYPDAYLNAMAHAGLDSILLFVKGVDRTPDGYQDFNDLVRRAAFYGLDVYVYSYLVNQKHPDDPGAEAYYDELYGDIFAACPGFKGIVLVGESCEFPSKDPHTTGVLRLDWPEDQPRPKPSPGWWPCRDYPEWLTAVKRAVRKYSPDADIVFWTYNWGWAPEADRLKLIRALPEDVTLLVTFEMFEQIRRAGVTHVCVDYTVSFEGPGGYFASEAQVAHERGLKLYAMANTGGLTWDIGVIPYQPVPYQWARRHAALLQAQADWNVSGLMESHHYGWWPSFVSDLAKRAYWHPRTVAAEDMTAAIARRDFGPDAAPFALEAWRNWSEGIRHYVPTNEDQYGPFRVGPSYPLTFRRRIQIPAAWHAMFGREIVETDYGPADGPRQSLGIHRVGPEIESLQRMAELWSRGNVNLERAIGLVPVRKREDAERLLGLNRFILHAVRTVIHVKQWWVLKQKVLNEADIDRARSLLQDMEQVAEREIANVEATIPLVQSDSRLGWEPSMDYMADRDHLLWKIAQVRHVLEQEFPEYRQSLDLTLR